MSRETVRLPGARLVEGTLEDPGDADTVVVECPPHPQYGGNRHDRNLTALSEFLLEHGIAALRIDYGEWDGGRGEQQDVETAIEWAAARYARVGLFGYSFGSIMAALAAAATEESLFAVSLLAPAAQVLDFDPASTLASIDAPLQVVYGTRDDTAEWEGVVEVARDLDVAVSEISGDHFFVGQQRTVAEVVGEHLLAH